MPLTRRRAFRVAAAGAGLPVLGGALWLAAPGKPTFHDWQGEALGAFATMRLWHADAAHARRTLRHAVVELQRLERVFSLYASGTELRRLNEVGWLERPSTDLRTVLDASQRIGHLSQGAFDISVQPLWELHRRHFDAHPGDPDGPTGAELAAARAKVDYRQITVGAARIELGLAGMALTLNGIAQGWITDRITDLLRHEGFDHAMIDTGEIRALGSHPEGRAWSIGLRDAQGVAEPGRTVELADAAVAVSGGYGLVFEPAGRHHHLFDPRTGRSAAAAGECAVAAPTAMVADALATAIFVGGASRAESLLAAFAGSRMIVGPIEAASPGPDR